MTGTEDILFSEGREGGPVGRTDEGAQFRLVESVSLLSRGQSFWSQGVVCKCLARMAGPKAQIDADDQSRLNRMTVSTPNCVKPIGVDTGFSVQQESCSCTHIKHVRPQQLH